MTIKLSICIPTYNFGKFIGETLNSIISQSDDRVQIVIVDGGSTDDTGAVVAEAAARFPRIKMIRREQNVGVDRDILESVSQADGEYCWLFSSDDVLVPGAVARVMAAIDEGGWDVLLTGFTRCGLKLEPLNDYPVLGCKTQQQFDWSDPARRAEYFQRAQTTAAFFSFISDIVVRRDRWMNAPNVEPFIGSCWIIAAKIFAISKTRLVVRFDPAVYLLKRGENDSFLSRGMIRRTALAVCGFREVAWHFFGVDSPEAIHVGRVLRFELPFFHLCEVRRLAFPRADTEQRALFFHLIRLHYADDPAGGGWYRHAVLRWTPTWLVTVMLVLWGLPFSVKRKLGI
ncbi:glycosyltransferase family 2 protein [Frigoriglobus tundricola]|uniref:GT2 family glycosyltransferase n=1 Tax=Frigoriglobus tundricola TaxID=2774151 RepID=A0A6M5Z216_9BACT|nr:glycosyltransferase family 2 protein [Frigoriglobus tundricola]QJX00478.1 GT2 family glycosyltransferase [Frigoriglobus tundricola]